MRPKCSARPSKRWQGPMKIPDVIREWSASNNIIAHLSAHLFDKVFNCCNCAKLESLNFRPDAKEFLSVCRNLAIDTKFHPEDHYMNEWRREGEEGTVCHNSVSVAVVGSGYVGIHGTRKLSSFWILASPVLVCSRSCESHKSDFRLFGSF